MANAVPLVLDATTGIARGATASDTFALGAAFQTAKTAAYTFVAGDLNTIVPLNSGTTAAFTIPTGIGANGDELYIAQDGAGAVSFIPVSGSVTITGANGVATSGPGDMRVAKWRSANVWYVL
jgi:hypothetical protein